MGHHRQQERFRAPLAVLLLTMALLVGPAAPPASPVPSSDGTEAVWSWPLAPDPTVLRQFAAPPSPWLAGHRGADLSASPGQGVLAPADAVVAFSGTVVDRGVLTLDHASGLRTSYEPVSGLVPVGTRVTRGQMVAMLTSQPGHCSPGTCLHWGLRRGSTYLDPLALVVGRGPPVLLPLAGSAVRSPVDRALPSTGRQEEAEQHRAQPSEEAAEQVEQCCPRSLLHQQQAVQDPGREGRVGPDEAHLRHREPGRIAAL